MRKAVITVDLGYGDAGKGATIDYLASFYREQKKSKIANVLYSGGSQRAHNIQVGGKKFTCSQIGSAAARGAITYHGPESVVTPEFLIRELNEFNKTFGFQPRVAIHPECLIATPFHRKLNRVRWTLRNNESSCGHGIGEARSYYLKYGDSAIKARDLDNRNVLREKMYLLQKRVREEVGSLLRSYDGPHKSEYLRKFGESVVFPTQDLWIPGTADMFSVLDYGVILDHEVVLFEASQGVLIDEFYGFHPDTTWSTVTSEPAHHMCERLGIRQPVVMGVTRSYMVRHGTGFFPTFCPELTWQLVDKNNPPGEMQGAMRNGNLDFSALRYAARCLPVPPVLLAVNHLDQVSGIQPIGMENPTLDKLTVNVSMENRQAIPAPVCQRMDTLTTLGSLCPVAIEGRGPSAEDRKLNPDCRVHLLS